MKRDYKLSLPLNENSLALFPKAIGLEGDDFKSEVVARVRAAFDHLEGLIQSLSVSETQLRVDWQAGPQSPAYSGQIAELLTQGNYADGILLLELFLSAEPENPDLLYNLGMAYSDRSNLPRAVDLLSQLVSSEPEHINGRVALGVAQLRMGNTEAGLSALESASKQAPDNLWARRNLGAGLLQAGRYAEALEHLRRATEIEPNDQGSWFGYGQALEALGQTKEADNAYQKALSLDEYSEIAERARRARTAIAEKAFRSGGAGPINMAAVMYILGALEEYARMTPEQVKKIGFEIAILGTRGIDLNDPDKKYTLQNLAGEFSGLHLLCLQYVAFKQIAPEQNIGFDLAGEYRAALAMFEQSSGHGQ
ncbi:MAG: tetratricopeptide repeat protein [Anaerolineales bacterium]|nr:tetratricopeptide repeat protein [Anaerolineales bacterium]